MGDEKVPVRQAALIALAHINDPAAAPRLIQVMGADPSARVRLLAAEALGVIGDPAASKALIQAMEDRSLRVRKEAALSLGSTGVGSDAHEALVDAMKRIRNLGIRRQIRRARRQLETRLGRPAGAKPNREAADSHEPDRGLIASIIDFFLG